MVAYSFKRRFIAPIMAGLGHGIDNVPKRQTIRSIGKKRHARPGEIIQLYCGLRTKNCFSIGVARCVSVDPIQLFFKPSHILIISLFSSPGHRHRHISGRKALDDFARDDGFADWHEMESFWREAHPTKRLGPWTGIIIKWEPIT